MTANADLIRLVHVGARELGLDADTRHDLQLRVTGKASLRDMDRRELQSVVEALKKQGFKAAPGPGFRKPAARGDVRYAHVLWKLLHQAGAVDKAGAAGLNAFIRARFADAWGATPIDIDRMQDATQIATVLEALKAIARRHQIDTRRRQ
jgi:phage gp16-like protein